LFVPHPANPDQGTLWIPKLCGGGTLKLVLARADEPAQQVHFKYEVYPDQGKVGLDEPESWLVTLFNPTTGRVGNNLLAVSIADPETGEIDEIPSSQPTFLISAFRMGFDLLNQFAQQAGLATRELFAPRTVHAIKEGEVHVVRSQWAAYFPANVQSSYRHWPSCLSIRSPTARGLSNSLPT
jgi:hypothetical protein